MKRFGNKIFIVNSL